MRGVYIFVVVIIAAILVEETVARGGRGGGGARGGSRGGSRARGGSRSGGGRAGSYKSAIAAGAVVYGMSRFRTRYYRSHGHYNDDPTVCYGSLTKYNSTLDHGTTLPTKNVGYFVCPDSEKFENDHCCGEEGKQTCCTYWDDPGRTAGAIVGFVIAGIVFIILVVVGIFCIKRAISGGKTKSNAPPVAHYEIQTMNQSPPPYPGYAPYKQ